jgi:phytanoyl-CoA hydroxylase
MGELSTIGKRFRDAGYVLERGLLAAQEVHELKEEAVALLERSRDQLGLNEVEPAARLGAVLCVHQPHKLSDVFLRYARHPRIVSVLRELIGENVKMVQTQLFIKGPGKPGNGWHQDESAIPTRDRSLVGVWIALDPASRENGCLRVVPGTHATGYLFPSAVHGQPLRYDFETIATGFDETASVDLRAEPGDAIFFHGYLVHGSEPNTSAAFRRALTVHYMNAYSLLPWKIPVAPAQRVVKPAMADYRDVVMVMGEDPYEWRGYSDESVPHLRRWGDSGRDESA